jgi:DNA-binding NtrC family response regulator
LFLDEVAELSLPAQALLLRALGEGEVVRVGDTRPRRVDVRVVAATSADLHQLVQTGRFRRDLYFRLRALHVRVPALRERGADWELIREYYLRALASDREAHKRFSHEALEVLSRYDWPGNVRGELIEPCHFLEALEEVARLDQMRQVPLIDVETQCWERLTSGAADFWEVVHGPYLARELSRAQVRGLIARGLAVTRGSFKRLVGLFGLPAQDYMRFMAFLRHHNLKPDRD